MVIEKFKKMKFLPISFDCAKPFKAFLKKLPTKFIVTGKDST